MRHNPPRSIRLAILLTLFLSCPRARAFIKGPPPDSLETCTVESLTIQSDLIFTADLAARTTIGRTSYDRTDVLAFEKIDILKKPSTYVPPPVLLIEFPLSRDSKEKFPEPGARVLVFLEKIGSRPAEFSIHDLVQIDLAVSPHGLESKTIRDLTLEPLTDPHQILSIVQAELHRKPPTTNVEYFGAYPYKIDRLPADSRLLPAARQWTHSADPLPRLLAARVFLAHPDPANIPALTSLLPDPHLVNYPSWYSPWSFYEYTTREIAASALHDLHAPIPPTIMTIPRDDHYVPLGSHELARWTLAPPLLCLLLILLWQKRPRKPKLIFRRSLLNFLTLLSLYAAIAFATLWHRSFSQIDHLVYANHGRAFDLLSFHGLILAETASRWPASKPPVHLALPADGWHQPIIGIRALHGGWPADNFREYYAYGEFWNLGIGASINHDAEAFTIAPRIGTFPSTPFPTTVLTISVSYLDLLILSLLLPTARLSIPPAFHLYRHFRTRRQKRLGLCLHCRYDLRAHPPGARCPECGTPVPSRTHTLPA